MLSIGIVAFLLLIVIPLLSLTAVHHLHPVSQSANLLQVVRLEGPADGADDASLGVGSGENSLWLSSPGPSLEAGPEEPSQPSTARPGGPAAAADQAQEGTVSSRSAERQTAPTVVKLVDGRQIAASQLNGRIPAAGLDSTYGKPGQFPLHAPILSTPGNRNPALTEAVINQFGVETNPRYAPDDRFTYCNTFAGDVARAMGAPLPTKTEMGIKADPATVAAEPLNRWLKQQSGERGWRIVDPGTEEGLQTLLKHVNVGKLAIASDPGHVVVIRPHQQGVHSVGDLHIAQAGAANLNDVRLEAIGLGTRFQPTFFLHD